MGILPLSGVSVAKLVEAAKEQAKWDPSKKALFNLGLKTTQCALLFLMKDWGDSTQDGGLTGRPFSLRKAFLDQKTEGGTPLGHAGIIATGVL